MRRWICLLFLALFSISQAGCFIAPWDPNPTVRTIQLMIMSEQLRQSLASMRGFMFMDDPSILSPQRLNGVVGP